MVSQHYWVCRSGDNIVTEIDGKQIVLAMFLKHESCFYKNGNRKDCRSNNLVTITSQRGKKKININGYIEIYMPEHHRAARGSGCVYEHILVAEEMLGRKLLPLEVVHHKDQHRNNNSPENLMVFATQGDHAAYHEGAKATLQDNGSYKCECKNVVIKKKVWVKREKKVMVKKHIKNICPFCNKNYKNADAEMCLECYKKKQAENIPPKEELEPLLGKISFVKIGEKYGVSDNAVRKWCKKYGLPFRTKDLKQAM